MSRVAKATIFIPHGVNVKIINYIIFIEGKNGKLKKNIHHNVVIKHENNSLNFHPQKIFSRNCWAQAGTTRALINKMIIGVNKGFTRKLQLIGVGYRVSVKENKVILSIGLSHNITYILPDHVTALCPSQTEIIIKGIDEQLVEQVAADIRSYRKPEPYKGKGIRYENEFIKIKESKKK